MFDSPFNVFCAGMIAGAIAQVIVLTLMEWRESRNEKPSVVVYLDDPANESLRKQFDEFEKWQAKREIADKVSLNV